VSRAAVNALVLLFTPIVLVGAAIGLTVLALQIGWNLGHAEFYNKLRKQ